MKSKIKELADRYSKVVEWSKEDKCYIGRIPALSYGGVHGKDKAKVFAEICEVAEEIVEIHLKDGRPLPKAGHQRFSGKFILRVAPGLHEALTLKAQLHGDSLNQFCEKALGKAI